MGNENVGTLRYLSWWLFSFVALYYSLSLALRVPATALSALWYVAIVSSVAAYQAQRIYAHFSIGWNRWIAVVIYYGIICVAFWLFNARNAAI